MAANWGTGLAVGLAAGTKNWPDIMASGMGLKANIEQQQSQRVHNEAILKIAQDKADMEKKTWDYEQKKLAQQETENNAIVPASLINPRFHETPGVRDIYVEYLQKNYGDDIKVTPTEIYGPKKAFVSLGNVMKTANETSLQASVRKELDSQAKADAISQKILELKDSGKQDEKTLTDIKTLETQYLGYVKSVAMAIQLQKDVQKAIAVEQAKVDRTLSADEIKALPDTDPRKIRWLKTEKDLLLEKERVKTPGHSEAELIQRALRGDKEAQSILDKMKEGKSLTEEQLTQKALKGNKEAQTILDQMKQRKVDIAKAGVEAKLSNIDTDEMAKAMADDRMSSLGIKNAFGVSVSSVVQSKVLKEWPKFNFMQNDANYKWKSSATNQRTINFAGGALPRLERLVQQIPANADLNTINRIMRQVSIETGKPEYTNFESNRNAIVQEINTALSGSSTPSDMRIKIELENLKGSRSPVQIKGAIDNLTEALIARMDVDLSPLYPPDVVRGERTMEQYKKELYSKFRGNYERKDVEGNSVKPNTIGRFTIEVQ